MYEIRKVKLALEKAHKVEMKYDNVRAGFMNDEHELRSSDDPHPDFVEAFNDLSRALLKEAELDGHFEHHLVTIKGLSVSYSDEMGRGAVISGTIELASSNAPLVINTPHKLFESENQPTLFFDTTMAIERVITEAQLFIGGKRAQGSLFDEPIEEHSEKIHDLDQNFTMEVVHS